MDYSKVINIQDRLTHDAVKGADGEMRGFKASDFVQVMNIDDEPYNWEFCTEEVITPDPSGFQATRDSKVEKFSLEPGQTTEMPGNIALVFIEGLTKKCIQKDGQAKLVNVVSIQDDWINRIFLGRKGVALPYANVNPDTGTRSFKAAEMVKEEVAFPEVDTKSEHILVGRPAKTTA